MSQNLNSAVAVIGIDIGKNSFHVVGLDQRGAIVLRQKWSRGQIEARLANLPPCLIGMEACVGAHHLSRKLKAFGHHARLMPPQHVRVGFEGELGGLAGRRGRFALPPEVRASLHPARCSGRCAPALQAR
jgi:transposase